MSTKEETNHFGINLRTARKHFGLKESQLAQIIGVDKTTVSKWETGDSNPDPENLKRLLAHFRVHTFEMPPDEFLEKYGLTGKYDGIGTIQLFTEDYERAISEMAGNAASFVNFSSLCLKTSRRNTFRPTELLDPNFCQRLKEGRIAFKRVQIFYAKQQLENAMDDACAYFGQKYHCKYFPMPPECVPVINMRSYDNRVFVIGGMYNEPADRPIERDLVFSDKFPIRDFLMEYWRLLWTQARPFPKPGRWDGIDEIAYALRMNDTELRTVVKKLRRKYPNIA